MARILSVIVLIGVFLIQNPVLRADDWPQWLGPNRDSTWKETGIAEEFPAEGLPVKWRVPVSMGYSGPAVANGLVYLTDYVRESGEAANDPVTRRELSGKERVLCLDAATGTKVWEHSYDRAYKISYPSGPRATPTVDKDRVYTLGAEGDLRCFEARQGAVLWSKDLRKEYHVESPLWGFSAAPLVHGDLLYCIVGGEGSVVVAFDKNNGQERWKALTASEPGYCAPSIIEAGGVQQLIIWHAEAINGLNPKTGALYWTVPLKPDYSMSIMVPRKHGDFLFASGIGNVGALLKLDKDKPAADVVWRGKNNTALYAANMTPVIGADGIMYGADCRGGQLRAVELSTGNRLWESFAPTTGTRRGTHGTVYIVKHEQRYFLFSETGDLILARLSAKGYEEIGRFHVVDPTGECFGREVVWSHPAFANRCVFARNDKELVCVSLAKQE